METFAVVIPSRDRPELFKFCREQIERQTIQPKNKYFIAFKPENGKPDLVKRIKNGVQLAKNDGIDYIVLIEDDDAYPSKYLEQIDFNADFFGYEQTVYYNIKNRTYGEFKHRGRSSLFCTGFKVSALDDFVWPPDDTVFLDIKIWEFAQKKKKKITLLKNNPCLGIKGHGEGTSGGKGHRMKLKNQDNDLSFLRSRVDPIAFEFYTDLMKRL